MNVITDSQWAEWRLSPVTQTFLKYLLCKKQEIARLKMEIASGPADLINTHQLAEINGIENTCASLLRLDLQTMTEGLKSFDEETREFRKIMKEGFGVDL